jgi:DNA-binding transcriptional LysR family regulator
MNIKSLNYFIEVAKEKSFTNASKNLFVCQSALSKAIKTFENELDITLIDRTSKHFKLTPEGQLLYENGVIALKVINEQLEMLLDSVSIEKGKIKVGVPPVISTIYFTSIIKSFKDNFHSINLQIIEAGANTVKDKVHNGEIDIGVVILPFSSDEFNITPIFSDVVVVANKSHPFASREEVSLLEIKDEPLISLNETYMLYDRIKIRCNEAGFEPNIICTSSQWDFIAEMVALNQGISILPKPILSKFHSKNIKAIHIKEGFPWNIAFIVRKDKYVSKAIKLFIEFTKNFEL